VSEIIEALLEPEAVNEIKPRMMQLRRSAESCEKSAKNMHKGFQDWLFYAMEIYNACVSTTSVTQEKAAAELQKSIEA